MSLNLANIFTSPRTTLAGLFAVVVAAATPAAVSYLGGQPGVGWQLIGMALGALVAGLMKDLKPKPT